MKKLLIAVAIICVGIVAVNAQFVAKQANSTFTGDPICRNFNINNFPAYCQYHAYGSYPCDLCPVCDDQGKLIKCGEGDLPANGACCVDVKIDLNRLSQVPSYCKIEEGQSHPCGQCPVYYDKPKDKCVECTGEPGQLFPCCHVFPASGGSDGVCPSEVHNPGKSNSVLTPVKPNANAKSGKTAPTTTKTKKPIK